MNRRLFPGIGVTALTFRERQMLSGYMAEPRQKLAAALLGMSYQTYKNHVLNILYKLDVERFGQAVVLYERSLHPGELPERRWRDRRHADRRIAQAGSGQSGQGSAIPVSAPPDSIRWSA